MIFERKSNEILIKLSPDIDIAALQSLLNYLEYLEATSKSKATEKDVIELAELANKNIWNNFDNNKAIQ